MLHLFVRLELFSAVTENMLTLRCELAFLVNYELCYFINFVKLCSSYS